MEDHYMTNHHSPYENAVSQPSSNQRRTLFTIKVGTITQWVRDILAIILMWKLIMAV